MYDENGEWLCYHLCCYKCWYDWWSNDGFPKVCPKCGKDPAPQKDEVQQYGHLTK